MSKKHKVKIHEGYEVDNLRSSVQINDNCQEEKVITIIFKPIEKELPKTWEEYRELRYKQLIDLLIPLKYYDSFEALGMLIELRDHYNDGWEPDWEDNTPKYCIYYSEGVFYFDSKVLIFKSLELRTLFYSNFLELIETAKPLL